MGRYGLKPLVKQAKSIKSRKLSRELIKSEH